jgi:hypothetical protein
MASRHICLIVITLVACGCAPLNSAPKQSNRLPPARLAPDAVILDVAFVRLKASDQKVYEAIWNAADEQQFPSELRTRLTTNGLRVGIIGQQLPNQIRELLETRPGTLEDLSEGATSDLEIGGSRQHLPVRAGYRSIIKASKVYPSLAVLLSEDGTVRGHQLADARCIVALKPYPMGDGRVKLGLTPEIEHGESKTRWTGSEGMMIQQTGQERLVLDRLRIDSVLSPGQSLLLSTTPEIKGLGESFFSQLVGSAVERRLLLIRFTQTQFDDLFAPEQTSAPLTTPGD